MNRIKSPRCTFRMLIALPALFLANAAISQPKNIAIRFTAASFFIQQDFQPNRPLDILRSSAGFDVVFRTQYYDDSTYYLVPGGTPEVLAALGTTTLRETDINGNPGATCDGTLHYDPKFPPQLRGQDITQDGPIKTVKIMIPGINNNTHAGVGLLSDPSQTYFACATPQIGTYVSGTGVQQTFAWYPTGNFIPEDSNPDSAGLVRGTNAVFQFDIRNLPVTVPLGFKRESRVVFDGKPVDEQTHVWFGQIYIYVDKGEQLTPIDPLIFRGYTPPQGLTTIPNDPPPEPTSATKDDWNNWLKDITGAITNHLNNVSKRWQQILGGAPALSSASTETFDLASSTAVITGLPPAPSDGTVEAQLILRDPEKTEGFKPKLSATAIANAVSFGASPTVSVLFDSKTKKALGNSKAYKAYVVVRVTPSDGSGVFEQVKKFNKKKSGKKKKKKS